MSFRSVVTGSSNYSSVADRPPLTDEQQAILNTAPNEQVLVIEAGAGTGKTSTLIALAERMGGRGQYTAFNKSLVDESKPKFAPYGTDCNTIHSLAFQQEGKPLVHRINKQKIWANEVAAMLGITPLVVRGLDEKHKTLYGGALAGMVLRATNRFCESDAEAIDSTFIPDLDGVYPGDQKMVKDYLKPFLIKAWEDLTHPQGTMPFNQSVYVKKWQLNNPIIDADYVLLDEAQDTSPVMLDVMRQQLIRGLQIILVGDSSQQIYSWRGAVNALAAFPDARRLFLSQSFRFGPSIAEVANSILSHLSNPSGLVLRGFDVPSRLDSLNNPDAVLCRTNSMAMQTIFAAIEEGRNPHLIGGGKEIQSFVKAIVNLQNGRRTEHPVLCGFASWKEVREFAETEEGEELRLMVRLIEKFTAPKIEFVLKNMPDEQDADLIVSTVHKSKGREWRKVKLARDFVPLEKLKDEDLRILYVAATRAKHVLDLESCPPFLERKQSENGGECSFIDIYNARVLSDMVPHANIIDACQVTKPIEYSRTQDIGSVTDTDDNDNENFTWSKGPSDGDWLVRGPIGRSGTIVTVSRRDGTTSRKKLGQMVWQEGDFGMYEIFKW